MMTSETQMDAPAPATQVADAVDRLRQTADELDTMVGAVEDRMACVTRPTSMSPPEPVSDREAQTDEDTVALAEWLGGISSRLQSLRRRMVLLLDRCEL